MQKGRRTEASRPIVVTCEAKLEGLYVRSLQALWTLGYFEFNRLAIVESLVAISHNGGEMDENVLATLALDEPKALAGIEPLHGTLFFIHCIYSFLSAGLRLSTTLRYLMPQVPRPSQSHGRLQACPVGRKAVYRTKKSRKCDLATAFLPKGDTRATNAKK